MASSGMNPRSWTGGVKPTTPIQDQSSKVQSVQARVVQHHYVRAELRDINMRKGGGLIQATLDALKLTPQGQRCTPAQLMEGFQHMTKRLQTADLSINFKAPSWFMTPNTYDSYTQMYERAVRKVAVPGTPAYNQMRLKGDALNPAPLRASADDKVTFRKDMMSGGKFKAAFGGLGRVMSPGTLAAPMVDAQDGEFVASNPYFNPKSKQVFAALNYGRRPHGSTVTYGHSYMVLNPKFKTNAIYFGGDTFGVTAGLNVAADDQISYDLLGAIYAKAQPAMRTDLYKSCIHDGRLPDSLPAYEITLLLEAHLFEPLTFGGNLEKIVLSGSDKLNGKALTGTEWQTIQTNARTFAAKHGAKLIFTD
jgi:hypothetical protein